MGFTPEAAQAKVVGDTHYEVLQRFIKQKCDRIARAVGLGVVSSHVETCLIEAARVTLETRTLELEDSRFFSLFMNNAALADQLVLEGLFMTTSGGKRFSFDEVAEFLQSKVLEFETILTYFSLSRNVQNLTTGAIVFAILRLNGQGKSDLVSKAISTITKAYTLFESKEEYGPKLRTCESVLAQIVQLIRNPERSITDIENYAANLARYISHEWFIYDRFSFRAAMARSAFPLRVKLNVLKLFLPKERSYDFEHHHWRDLKYKIHEIGHTGGILAELIQSSPVPAFEILIEWLTDTTYLRSNNSTIADAAMGLMFYYRHLAFERLCELAARSGTQKSDVLLKYVCKNDPVELLDILVKWVNQNDPVLLKYCAGLATYLAGESSANTLEDKLYEVLTRVMSRVNAETDSVANVGIGRLPKYREGVVEKLIARFRRGDPKVDGYAIAELANTHFDAVVSAVRQLIKSNAEEASNAVSALTHQSRSPEQFDAMIDLINLGADQGLLRFYSFRFAIENLLFQSNVAPDVERVMAMVKHVIGMSVDVRLHLRQFACAPRRWDIDGNLQDRILELLFETRGEDDGYEILHHLIEVGRYHSEDLKTFLSLQQMLPIERFHQVLIGGAYMHSGFAKPLIDWLQHDGGISPYGSTQMLLDRIRQGESCIQAVRNVFAILLNSYSRS